MQVDNFVIAVSDMLTFVKEHAAATEEVKQWADETKVKLAAAPDARPTRIALQLFMKGIIDEKVDNPAGIFNMLCEQGVPVSPVVKDFLDTAMQSDQELIEEQCKFLIKCCKPPE